MDTSGSFVVSLTWLSPLVRRRINSRSQSGSGHFSADSGSGSPAGVPSSCSSISPSEDNILAPGWFSALAVITAAWLVSHVVRSIFDPESIDPGLSTALYSHITQLVMAGLFEVGFFLFSSLSMQLAVVSGALVAGSLGERAAHAAAVLIAFAIPVAFVRCATDKWAFVPRLSKCHVYDEFPLNSIRSL